MILRERLHEMINSWVLIYMALGTVSYEYSDGDISSKQHSFAVRRAVAIITREVTTLWSYR